MRRYIALTAVILAMTGCGAKESEKPEPAAPAVSAEVSTEIESETASETPDGVKIDVAAARSYCVSVDAARTALITDYKDKIPEKLQAAFDANSDVLDECMEQAAGNISDEEAEKIFNKLTKLEVFFCSEIAEEVGAGDKIQEVALAATKGADYYFEKTAETSTEDASETESETETEETTKSDKKDKKDK